ncbi:hypothetical protein ADK86_27520 [Streptomyces sp. NRRL F-5755]|nr:hypothetical protein ADK86_27520 [Streptomyces sp. NRRL F-5755]
MWRSSTPAAGTVQMLTTQLATAPRRRPGGHRHTQLLWIMTKTMMPSRTTTEVDTATGGVSFQM